MPDSTVSSNVVSIGSRDALNEILRQGARQMLAQAIENEVAEYLARHAHQRDENGRRLVVRNGYLPARDLQTSVGLVEVRQPPVRDQRRDAQEEPLRFTSKILLPYLRRTKNIDELIPWLYLRGISTGDFAEALQALVGPQAKGLSADPSLATGDGALGFWAALREIYPATREQRCWVHKTANVLTKLPKSIQARAKAMLHEIWMAETRQQATHAFDRFVESFKAKYPKAVECLVKDREVLLTFYDFPAAHRVHLRTTHPIESTFATVRLRTARTKGCGSRTACLTMVFKRAQCAERQWRRLNGAALLGEVIRGVVFVDGLKDKAA